MYTHFPCSAITQLARLYRESSTMSVSAFSKSVKIFFSYAFSAPKDKRLFERLATHLAVLRRQHIIAEMYDSELSPGSTLAQWIEATLNTVDIIVLLISADFVASERCYEVEMKRALELHKAGLVELIPVLLQPTDLQGLPIAAYQPLPENRKPVSKWRDRDEALQEVAKGIRRVIEQIAGQVIRKQANRQEAPLYVLPYRQTQFFTDREAVLATLSATFAAAQPPQLPVLALSGLGGVGKTQIALAYTFRASQQYQTVLWLNASSREDLSMEVNGLADRLSLPQEERADEQRLFAAVKNWLQTHSSWLLVLDQIDDMTLTNLLVPTQGNGHVLLTTHRQAAGDFASVIPITPMEAEASVELLLRRAHISQTASADVIAQATTIAQELDGFPLALDQVGAYLEETGCGLAAYLELYQHERATLLGQRGQLANNHPASVLITLKLAIEKVTGKQVANLDLLRLLAFLQPDAIPEEMFVDGAEALDEPLRTLATNRLTLHQALADLLSFSLVQRCADATTLCIHRIAQAVISTTLTLEQQQHWASRAILLVNRVFPQVSSETWAECNRFLPQARHCAQLIADFQLTLLEAAPLLERLGSYCYLRADYNEAETYLTQALHLHEQRQWEDSIEAARTLNTLGRLYHRQARYAEAEQLHLRALELREQALGPDDPETAESLHNLAVLYGKLGEYQRAEQFYLRVHAIDERTGNTEDLEAAKTLNNLAMIYYLQGNYPQAETAYQRVLALYERILPTDANNIDLAYPLNGLGVVYERLGRFQEAEQLYQRALTIREHTLGDKHPETAHSLHKLATIYVAQKHYQQAEQYYQRALSIFEQHFGSEHPDTLDVHNNLELLHQEIKQERQGDN